MLLVDLLGNCGGGGSVYWRRLDALSYDNGRFVNGLDNLLLLWLLLLLLLLLCSITSSD